METKLFLETVESIENKEEAFHILIQFLTGINESLKEQALKSIECRASWQSRMTQLESNIHGVNGVNGFKVMLKNHENRIDLMEKNVAKWVTRLTTALVIFNGVVLPLVLYLFFHLLKSGVNAP